jgi:Sec-independent protein secretion pathway component TatC
MDNAMIQVRNPRFLNLTVYLVVAIMVIISYITMPDALTQAAAIALCIAFGLVHALVFRRRYPGRMRFT